MINQWKRCLLDHAEEWGMPKSGEWSFLFYNNYQPNCSDMDILWFYNREPHPRVVTKVSREPNRPAGEFAGLQRVHSAAPQWTPRPLHFGQQGRFWTLWMEGVPGSHFKGEEPPEALRSMVETVAGIHHALRQPRRPSPDLFHNLVVEPLRFLSAFGSSAAVAAGCRALLAGTTPEWLTSLPSIPQHGDLYEGNLLYRNGAWQVIDWETFGMIDLPAYDLFTMLLSTLLRAGPLRRNWRPHLTAQMPALVRLYSERIGIPASDTPALLPLTLANWFHLQARDGRARFSQHKYPAIVDFFEHRREWETVFFSKPTV